MTFVRRYTQTPSLSVITQIEGIIIIDLPPPTTPVGVTTNVIAMAGEFADHTYAVAIDSSGNVTTSPNPVQIVSGQDLLDKLGPFDSSIGNFGGAMGNGYVELRNKTFGTLVVVPVNICSAAGIRMWRSLPTNLSATQPTPVVPVSGAFVPAGYALTDAAHPLERMHTGKPIQFAANPSFLANVDGSVTNTAAAAVQPFISATGTFSNVVRPDGYIGVQVGDILVIGVIGGSGANATDAGQYRVVSVTNDTTISVQAMNGANFAFATTASNLAWRLHAAPVADSYGYGQTPLLASQGSFNIPVHPLTNDAGTGSSASNGTWATGTALNPVVVPPALTGSSADPLSGLAGLVGPTTAIAYTANVQAPNAVNNAAIDALYQTALLSLLNDDLPESTVSHVWAARKSQNIRVSLNTTVNTKSARGIGTTCSISPELSGLFTQTTALATVTQAADPGVGANRSERVFYNWPPVQTFVSEAANIQIATADGNVTFSGQLDVTADGWMASVLGNLPPERNPGEVSATTQTVLAPILGYARAVPLLDINAWILLKASGISGIRIDANTGPEFQSGITSSLTNGQTSISRRKMADYIEDSLGQIAKPYNKLPATNQNIDSCVAQINDFLTLLQSPDNAAAQRINSFVVDPISGNSPAMAAANIFVIIVRVQTLPSMDFIVIQVTAGPGVVTGGTQPSAGQSAF